MKRLWISVTIGLLLAACGASAPAESPQQAVAATAQKMGSLHTIKFDLQGSIATRIPPEVLAALTNNQAQQGSSVAALANSTLELKGNGEAVYPDQVHVSVQVTTPGLSILTEQVVAGGKVYTKNPLTGQWTVGDPGQFGMQLNQLGPLSARQILDTAGSIKDLGDTTISGNVSVHHYLITPDKSKLVSELETNASFTDPKARQALAQALSSGTLTFEVWISKDDHLLRSMKADADVAMSAGQLAGGAQVPASAAITITTHLTMTFHDFNAPITITIPKT